MTENDPKREGRLLLAAERVSATLDTIFNRDAKDQDRTIGFVLVIFPFDKEGDDRWTTIHSNANADDVVVLMKDMIHRLEGDAP